MSTATLRARYFALCVSIARRDAAGDRSGADVLMPALLRVERVLARLHQQDPESGSRGQAA